MKELQNNSMGREGGLRKERKKVETAYVNRNNGRAKQPHSKIDEEEEEKR